MDKASDFGSEDCEFESRRGRYFIVVVYFCFINVRNNRSHMDRSCKKK